MNAYQDFGEPDYGNAPKLDERPIEVRRAEVIKDLAEFGPGYQGFRAERAAWTDAQWLADDERIRAEIRAHEQAREEKRQRAHFRALENAGWPSRALQAAQQADLTVQALKFALEWDPAQHNILVLSGPPGCGKTTAAAYRALRVTNTVTFVRASTFARASRYGKERDAWLGAGALVLDDLGSEYIDAKGSFQTDLDELIDTVYGDRSPMIITTNCTNADFRSRYSERVFDRLRECGRWFEIRSESLRGKR